MLGSYDATRCRVGGFLAFMPTPTVASTARRQTSSKILLAPVTATSCLTASYFEA